MKNLFVIVTWCLFIGCAMTPLQKTAIRQSPLEVKTKTKSISVSKVVDTVAQRRVIGKAYGGLACVPHGELYWTGNEKILTDVSNLARTKLDKYGYSLIGKAHSPFNDEYNKQVDLLLGGKIADVQSNMCYSINGAKGEVFVKVDWELYDIQTKNIILSLTSEGFSSTPEFIKTGDKELYDKAFDMVIDNLLAEKSFFKLLTDGK